LPRWKDGLLMAQRLAERPADQGDTSADADNFDAKQLPSLSCTDNNNRAESPVPGKIPLKQNISKTNEQTDEEKAVDILSLFTALYAYLASVKKEGLDKANARSLKVHNDLFECQADILLNLPSVFADLREKNPSQFTRLLRQYPDNDDEFSFFQGATVYIPKEHKTMDFGDFVKAIRDGSMTKPDRYQVIRKPQKPNKRRNADLHDPGCYFQSLILSLLAGREDFITKGVNLSVAQDEGLAIMDGDYAELGGEQGIAESLALNLGYDWTLTLERQVERMIVKIRSEMTE
jgi:hypothetical protein